MSAPRRLTAQDKSQLICEIRDIVDRLQNEGTELKYIEQCELEFAKWRKMHKLVHASPFHTNRRLKRSDQWRDAINRIRDIGEPELFNWCLLQLEVAANIERGIREMRPRKNGPCYELILEYVSDRKRKALAVLHFAIEGEKHGIYGLSSNADGILEKIRPVPKY